EQLRGHFTVSTLARRLCHASSLGIPHTHLVWQKPSSCRAHLVHSRFKFLCSALRGEISPRALDYLLKWRGRYRCLWRRYWRRSGIIGQNSRKNRNAKLLRFYLPNMLPCSLKKCVCTDQALFRLRIVKRIAVNPSHDTAATMYNRRKG